MTREASHLDESSSASEDGLNWRLRGACFDMDADTFFPIGAKRAAAIQYAHARQVCQRCEVSTQCLQFALDTRTDFGVWGGITPLERKRMQWRREHAEGDRRALFGINEGQAPGPRDEALSPVHISARDQVPDVRAPVPTSL